MVRVQVPQPKYSELLKKDRKCPFCRHDRKRVVADNKTAFLTYSIAPYHRDHLLVVPKRHIENLLELSKKEIENMNALQIKGLKILKKLGHKHFSVLTRNGHKTGRSISHLHCNIIPNVPIGNINVGDGNSRKVLTEKGEVLTLTRLRNVL